MNFGIVIFPTKKMQDYANSFRKRYDPHYALITPHVTLKSSFEASDEQIKEIAEKLHNVAMQHLPFQLNVLKISSFQPVNNVIYLKVEPTKTLDALQEDIQTTVGGSEGEYSFVPHITIGQKLSNDEHSDIYGSLRMTKVNHEEIVDRFHLLYQLDNGSWTVYETFRLGKEK
ncbi:YjcG family protein [Cytobacillus spongiae]|jgi:2'-5' RNA ligase|uniref:YjcG family protein n=1 Tax=Cytobacillus spongiae TaxID=2901381 RepID=UPI001F362092|nr:YjcG family protein [Cytobacillus spongiae]UII57054.1 YjcG family protein [Cytobacillus spongiae]